MDSTKGSQGSLNRVVSKTEASNLFRVQNNAKEQTQEK